MPNSVALDRFDRALLAQVQVDNQLPARRLAERVGLSESAVLRRLRRLRREGVIVADVSVVHPGVLGLLAVVAPDPLAGSTPLGADPRDEGPGP